MGAQDGSISQTVTKAGTAPAKDEFELTLFGPGYGESVVLHVGDGVWVIVDSCIDTDGIPRAQRYLENMGLDLAQAVNLVIATHWHDDHIRGMARLVEACSQATFCCSAALCQKEFLSVVGTRVRHHFSVSGSGAQEVHDVFTRLMKVNSTPEYALVDRCIFSRGACKIWSLSPSNTAFQNFLIAIGGLLPREGETRARTPDLLPNQVAVVLWIEIDDVVVLLGSDMERGGWVQILQSTTRPPGRASAFKIPHHGSANADVPEVWAQMLDTNPFAVLTPWRKGGRALPGPGDVERILSNTVHAYASARGASITKAPGRRVREVDRTIREAGIKLQRPVMSPGMVRMRRYIGSRAQWQVDLFGTACHLKNF